MKIYLAHSNDFDYENKLYKPLRASPLSFAHEIYLPHENEQRENTRDMIKTCDLMIAEVSLPSTGEGIEIGRAEAAGVPILCISETGAKVSRSLSYVTDYFLQYSGTEDLLPKLETFIADFRSTRT